MANFVLSAFADEAGKSLQEQISALKANGINYIEPRSIDGKGILSLTEDELIAIKSELDKNGIKVNSLGSPIGKYPITEDFEGHSAAFEKALRACEVLETKNMRVFSFYIPKGEDAAKYTDEVTRRLKIMVELARGRGIILNHENEKEIFGQNPPEVSILADKVNDMRFIFDGANYRECNCNTMDGINATLKNLGYLHIKDAIYEPHMIVPAGEGEAKLDKIIDIVNEHTDDTVFLTVEPHLHIFDAFKDIDNTELVGKYTFENSREAFNCAVSALKALLTKLGYKEECSVWKK